MDGDRPRLYVIPTELERQDAKLDIGILLVVLVFGWKAIDDYGVSWAPVLAVWLVVGLWSLTGEPAADVGWVGNLAAALRSKAGQRRAHEWLLAYGHYWHAAVYPVWRTACLLFLNSARRRTHLWLRQKSAATRCWLSHAYLWVLATRPNWSVRRGR